VARVRTPSFFAGLLSPGGITDRREPNAVAEAVSRTDDPVADEPAEADDGAGVGPTSAWFAQTLDLFPRSPDGSL
jgi:hypothetical protein